MVANGTFTINSTGTLTISSLPFTPSMVTFTVSANGGADETTQARISTGSATADFKGADALLVNSNGYFTQDFRNDSSRCLVALGTPGGTLTRVLDARFVQFVTNGIELNVVTKHSSYTFSVRAEFYS